MLDSSKQHIQKLSVAKMRMLRWKSDNTLKDRIKYENIRGRVRGLTNRRKMIENPKMVKSCT